MEQSKNQLYVILTLLVSEAATDLLQRQQQLLHLCKKEKPKE